MVSKWPGDKLPSVIGDDTPPAAPTRSPAPQAFPGRNSDFPWDKFDSTEYHDHNYKALHDDDRYFVEIVRDFFATLGLSRHKNGIDVGSGSNLYPALTMLPFCNKITLYEYANSNIKWLQREIQSYSSSWDAFWELLAKEPPYQLVQSPQKALAAVACVQKGNIFDLPESQWDIGTMFFTAESISSELSEFSSALRKFIRSLQAGAPFAAAFMRNSEGYPVGARWFPAVAITVNDVENCLVDDATDLEFHQVDATEKKALRTGYDGMILVTGRVVEKN